jgi:hypothetical protein
VSKTPRARLASGERTRLDTDTRTPALAGTSGARVVRTGDSRAPLPLRVLRQTVGLIALLAGIGVAIYAVLAITVLVVLSSGDDKALVLRGAYPVGQAPTGAYVYVSSTAADHTFSGKVAQAINGVPSGSVVQIVAGPATKIGTDADGYIVADGERTEFQADVDPYTLGREYVALCVSGACTPGEAVLVGQDNVIGAVKGYVSAAGLTRPDAAN